MTIAELHGKLAAGRSAGYEYMEDLLTSDVFGTMRYAGWEQGFLDWLLMAENAPVEPQPEAIGEYLRPDAIEQMDICFWPVLKNNREPDAGILSRRKSGSHVLVLMEAKLYSGPSDWDEAACDDEDSQTGSQLVDQVWGLKQMPQKDLMAWFEKSDVPEEVNSIDRLHLFVTRHVVLPKHYYDDAKAKAKTRHKDDWPVASYWLSWTSLGEQLERRIPLVDGGIRALLADLHCLLQRKGLIPFRGFHTAAAPPTGSFPSFWDERWWVEQPWANNAPASFWHHNLTKRGGLR